MFDDLMETTTDVHRVERSVPLKTSSTLALYAVDHDEQSERRCRNGIS